MAKASKVEQIVAEMKAERDIVLDCIDRAQVAEQNSTQASAALAEHSDMLAACIARLTGNGTEPAPTPRRTRKGRKATEPSI